MSIYRTLGRISRVLSIRRSASFDGVLHGNAVLGCHVANGVSGSPNACLRQLGYISNIQDSCANQLATSVGRGFSSGRDEEGLQASQKSRTQEGPEHRNSGTDGERHIERKQSVTCARSSDDELPDSSGQQENDTQQDAAAHQDHGQAHCKRHRTDDGPGQQQQPQDDTSATGMVWFSLRQNCSNTI